MKQQVNLWLRFKHTACKHFCSALVVATICTGAGWQTPAHGRTILGSQSSYRLTYKLANAKDASISSPTLSLQQPSNCEDALLYLDGAIENARDMKDSYLIVIARLGKRERSNITRVRMDGIESYIKRKSSIKYVVAEGSSVKGLGQLEIYIGGKLFRSLSFKKNALTFCPVPIG